MKKENEFRIIKNKKTEALDKYYSELAEIGAFNGNILVAEKGEIIFQKSFGLKNIETKEKIDLETVFEIASVTKQFTAAAILLLVKENKLSLDDLFSKYIPELSFYEDITIKSLIIHTSGITDHTYIMEREKAEGQIVNNEDVIRTFAKLKPEMDFKANELHDYSNIAYLLLASIVERVSKMSFEDYLKEKIFKPLKMDNTCIYQRIYNPKKIENLATSYRYNKETKNLVNLYEAKEESHYIYLDGCAGDGAINTNIHDLFKWDRALNAENLFSKEDKEIIFSSYKTAKNEETNYGFGWNIGEVEPYGRIAFHPGGWAGYFSYIERHLDTDRTIIYLQNYDTPDFQFPIRNTRRILIGEAVEKQIKIPEESIKKYLGKYIDNETKQEEIIVFDDEFILLDSKEEYLSSLVPLSETDFVAEDLVPEKRYIFSFDEQGNIKDCKVKNTENALDKSLYRKK